MLKIKPVVGKPVNTTDTSQSVPAGATASDIQSMIDKLEGKDPAREAELRKLLATAQREIPEVEEVGVALPPGMDKMRSKMDSRVIGQDHVKDSITRFLEKKLRRNRPNSIVIAGPSGVGKSEMAKAIALALHDDPEKMLIVEANKVDSKAGLASIIGSPPMYVGYEKPGESDTLPISNKRIQQLYGDKRPLVILIDEVDKIGKGLSKEEVKALKTSFWQIWNRALDKGILTLANNESIDIRGAIVIITSNAGMEEAKGLPKGEALRAHYRKYAEDDMPTEIRGRVGNFTVADPLGLEETKEIVGQKLGLLFKEAEDQLKEEGKQVRFFVDEGVKKLIGEISSSFEYGVRPMEHSLAQLIEPLIARAMAGAKDEERFHLSMKAIDDVALADLKRKFAASHPSIPPEFNSETMPIRMTKSPRASFAAYEGKVPDGTVLGSGLVTGRGFVAVNNGKENELYLMKQGVSDRFIAKALPPELAAANTDFKVSAIDGDRLLIVATHVEKNEAKTMAFVFDARDGSCDKVASPPKALAGAALGGVGGKGVLFGGREMVQDADGEFPVAANEDLLYSAGRPISNAAYVYDADKNAWTQLDGDVHGRAGAAPVVHNGELYFLGGEEVLPTERGTFRSHSSVRVDKFNPDSGKLEPSHELSSGVAYGTAFIDEFDRLRLAGGITYTNHGREYELRSALASLDLGVSEPSWKVNEQLPGTAAGAAVIPHPSGRLVGPVYDQDGKANYFLRS